MSKNSMLASLPFSCPLCYHNSVDSTRRRLLYYLLLNVVISVCATASVLFIYDRFFKSPGPIVPEIQPAQVTDRLEITAVVGTGLLESEMVVLRNSGQDLVDLTGWQLKDEDANMYTFAELTLPPGAAVQLHTASGKDTLIDRYWGLTAPAWRSGETVTLLDAAGIVKSVYKVP
jgi:hypothetical protein